MGGRATTCSLDISDYPSSVNWGNTLFNDLWVRDYDPSRDWFSNIEDELVHSR